VALKQMAFGRTRPDETPVDRDFSDVILLFDRLGDQIAGEVANSPTFARESKKPPRPSAPTPPQNPPQPES
jgi:hypothetical protein